MNNHVLTSQFIAEIVVDINDHQYEEPLSEYVILKVILDPVQLLHKRAESLPILEEKRLADKYKKSVGNTYGDRADTLGYLIFEQLEQPVLVSTDRIAQLIRDGANIDVQDMKGITLLMQAIKNGNVGVIMLLIRAGAQINVQDEHGNTALMIAAMESLVSIVRILLEHGAWGDMCNNDNKTAVMLTTNEYIKTYINNHISALQALDMQGRLDHNAAQPTHLNCVLL